VEDEELYEEVNYRFLEDNNINLARAFLGMDGGYSIRKLKKLMVQAKQDARDREQEELEDSKSRRAQYEEDEEESLDAAAAEEGGAAAEEGADEEGGEEEEDDGDDGDGDISDESDIDQILDVIDEETFEKMVAEADSMKFTDEEGAKAFFDTKLKEWSRMRIKKQKKVVDEREKTDPYYAMMKTEKTIGSRYSNEFDLEDEDIHGYDDMVEKTIGRYPEGFRQFENYENYRIVVEGSSIQDYHIESKYFAR